MNLLYCICISLLLEKKEISIIKMQKKCNDMNFMTMVKVDEHVMHYSG